MQKLKTFWYSFQRSLLDPMYYQDIAKARYWFSFKYLLFLLVCLSLIRSVQLGSAYSSFRKEIPSYISTAKKELTAFYPKELELRISNGKLYTNVVEPYTIEFPKVFGDMEGKHLIVIDTKGIADDYPKYNTVVLATRKTLIYPDKQQGSSFSTKAYYFTELKRSIYIDHSLYVKLIRNLDPFIAKLPEAMDIAVIAGLLLLPVFGALLWSSGVLFGLVFLTLFVWLIEKIMKTSYGYKTLFRMGIHGSTWSILFTYILESTNKNVPYVYNIIFICWMIFVLYKNQVKLLPEKTHI